jgi:uncharacterized low-complexity protein
MHKTFLIALLLGALMMGATAQAQQQPAQKLQLQSVDLAVTYSPARAKIAQTDCGCFWMQGGSADAAATFFHGLGVAANLTGERTSNITLGVDLSKISFMIGPRYTYNMHRATDRFLGSKHPSRVFGEWLFGGVYGFNSVFPTSGGVKSNANAFSMQLGGGMDVSLARSFSVRAIELDWVRSNLPNTGSDTQNDLRLAFGMSYHIQKH